MRIESDVKQLSYTDVAIVPGKCIVSSRKECSTTVRFGIKEFLVPVYPANMKSVVNINTCKFLASKNWFYTMHRFGVDILDFAAEMNSQSLFVSISIGIGDEWKNILLECISNRIPLHYITIDVANAWSDRTKGMVLWVKDHFQDTFLIVGNVATGEAVLDLQNWGADAIKCGIAGGKVCTTKKKTGVFRPMVSCISDCFQASKVPIIADGGIEEFGDISKAIICGATMVMAGFLFSGYYQSAGDLIEVDGQLCKEYFGSASEFNKDSQSHIEGKKILVPYKSDMTNLMTEIQENLQSSISYCGGNNLNDLRSAKFYIV